MATATLRRQVLRLKTALDLKTPRPSPVLDRIRRDPANLLALAGLTPDPWQARVIRSSDPRLLMLAGRQVGKSQVAAALVLKEALLNAPALILILSRTDRQSGELLRDKVRPLYRALGQQLGVRVVRESELQIELANGSRVIALPGKEETVRCYSSVKLLVLDEAARVPDSLYYSVRPMLSVAKGKLVALSTPFGRRGWFYEEWEHGGPGWKRVEVRGSQCPRHTPEFLAEERDKMGDRWYAQEYELSFEEMVGAVFDQRAVAAMFTDELGFFD